MGGRRRGQAGSPCAAEAGRGRVGREAGRATGARAEALETRRPASRGPGGTRSAGTPGRAAEARGRTRGRQQDPESRLGWSGGELGAGPAIPPRGRTGCLRTWVSEAKHAHARRKVMVGRPALLLPGSSAARGRDPGRCGKEPGGRRAHPSSGSPGRSGARHAESAGPQLRHFVLREGTVVGRYLERPHIRLQLKESFKEILKENATFRGF